MKPSAKTGFNTLVSASSNQTKLYGNGLTAGQIALLGGMGGAMLFGPGNSQAHLVLCGGRAFDVHALKAHVGACTTTATAGGTALSATVSPNTVGAATNAHGSSAAQTGLSTSAGLSASAGAHGTVATGANTSATGGVLGTTATAASGNSNAGAVLGATTQSGNLPFTGLALGVPLGLALMLLVSGLAMRRAARS